MDMESTNIPTDLVVSKEFKQQVKNFKKDFYGKYKEISQTETPRVDGSGKKIIEKRPDGKDYIIDAYMSDMLDKYFPGWSWECAAPLQFLGSEWVVAQGTLTVIDEHLLVFGIKPPVRKYYGVDAVRVQFKRDKPHTPENIIDIGDNCQSANTGAKKRAINRLTHIGDDIYGKRIEQEGAGSYEDVVLATGDFTQFGRWVDENKLTWGEVKKILGCEITEVKDWAEAMKKIKAAKGWK